MASSQLNYSVSDSSGLPQGWYDCATGSHVLRGVTFVDAGDVTPQLGESGVDYGNRLGRVARRCVALGSIPVIFGGDHSISYWLISAVQSASPEPIAVLHLDAHSDISERSERDVPANGSFARWIIEENPEMPFVSVGIKGFLIRQQPSLSPGHTIISAAEAAQHKSEWILAHLPENMPCYVSLDLDVLEPSIAPATNVPIPGGLTFEAVREILTKVGSHRRIVGVDVVELNPDRDLYLKSASAGMHLLMSLLGPISNTYSNEGGDLL
jgi:agmatinase